MADKGTQYDSRFFEKGDWVFREGSVGREAYLIKQGRVALTRTLEGQEVVLDNLGPGNIFGEMAVISGEPRTAGARAESDTELVVIDRGLVNRALDQSPPLVRQLVDHFFERLKATTARISTRTTPDAMLAAGEVLDMMLLVRALEEERSLAEVPGVSHKAFMRRAKRATGLAVHELQEALEELASEGVASIHPSRTGRHGWEYVITLGDPATFLERVEQAAEGQREKTESGGAPGFLDVSELADRLGTSPEQLFRRLAEGELAGEHALFPEHLATDWAKG